MACRGVCSICYRKRKVILILCTTALFWVVYLILILPNDDKLKVVKADRYDDISQKTTRQQPIQKKYIEIEEDKSNGKHVIKLDLQKPAAGDHISLNISFKSNNESIVVVKTPAPIIKTTAPSGLQIGKQLQKLKNNTINLGAKVKETLSDLGLIAKKATIVKHIKRSSVFNLNMTNDAYMQIIKTLIDTDDKSKKSLGSLATLSPTSGKLSSGVNHSCVCYDVTCSCCVRLQISMLMLKNIVCANLTFLSKTQEFDLKFSLDHRVIYNETVSAQHPPTICMGSVGSLANSLEICSTFTNVTFRVNMHDDHKTQLNGCINFSLAVFNRTISSFPLGCFQIPGEGQRNFGVSNLGNWMP